MSTYWKVILLAVIAVAVLATAIFSLRAYRSWQLLQSARESGSADTASIRPWMTIGYIAQTYQVPESVLADRLGVPPESAGRISLRLVAQRRGQAPLELVRIAQRAVAELRPPTPGAMSEPQRPGSSPGSEGIGDALLEAMLLWGYPVLALIVFVGSIGLPLPVGLATSVVGSLVAQGHLTWLAALGAATLGSALGDLAGYEIGRTVGRELLERHGRWIGLTRDRLVRSERFFERWGASGLLLSRTLLSGLSSAVNLLAGVSHYRRRAFVLYDLAGRLVWSALYLGIGYGFARSADLVGELLDDVLRLLASLAVAGAAAYVLHRHQQQEHGRVDPD